MARDDRAARFDLDHEPATDRSHRVQGDIHHARRARRVLGGPLDVPVDPRHEAWRSLASDDAAGDAHVRGDASVRDRRVMDIRHVLAIHWIERVVGVVLLCLACDSLAQIPPDAKRYKRDLIRNARAIWGLDAPTSTFAAQIHQESGWRVDAKSPV